MSLPNSIVKKIRSKLLALHVFFALAMFPCVLLRFATLAKMSLSSLGDYLKSTHAKDASHFPDLACSVIIWNPTTMRRAKRKAGQQPIGRSHVRRIWGHRYVWARGRAPSANIFGNNHHAFPSAVKGNVASNQISTRVFFFLFPEGTSSIA
jgi:hypothetical protein